MVALLLALACQPSRTTPAEPNSSDGGASEVDGATLSAREVLVRASLDLRGVRPSRAELDAVEADSAVVDSMLEEFLVDERWPGRVRSLYSEVYLGSTEFYPILVQGFGADTPGDLWMSVGEEPLRILSTVADEDLPWTEIVTADWTMADENLAAYWPVDYPEGETGWRVSSYTDGRPSAGVLSANGFHWRYTSTQSNANRGRANAVSRALLCSDYMERPIEFDSDVSLLDEEAVREALTRNPTCVNCHSSLDPLASHFCGFSIINPLSPVEASFYHLNREQWWKESTGVAPEYFGQPSDTLEDLAHHIAADPRFVSCVVEQVTGFLLRRDVTDDDPDLASAHREAFIDGGLTLRSLYRSLLADPRYRAADDLTDGGVPLKLVTSDLLSSQVEDLTGFTWTLDGEESFDALATDEKGVRILAGGIDGYSVRRSATQTIPTLILVQQRLAEAAAAHAVKTDASLEPSVRSLFTLSTLDETPDGDLDGLRAQVEELYVRTLSEAPDETTLDGLVDLWVAYYETEGDAESAWIAIFALLMRDPGFLLY